MCLLQVLYIVKHGHHLWGAGCVTAARCHTSPTHCTVGMCPDIKWSAMDHVLGLSLYNIQHLRLILKVLPIPIYWLNWWGSIYNNYSQCKEHSIHSLHCSGAADWSQTDFIPSSQYLQHFATLATLQTGIFASHREGEVTRTLKMWHLLL